MLQQDLYRQNVNGMIQLIVSNYCFVCLKYIYIDETLMQESNTMKDATEALTKGFLHFILVLFIIVTFRFQFIDTQCKLQQSLLK